MPKQDCLLPCANVIQFSSLPCIIVLGCVEAMRLTNNAAEERSAVTYMLKEMKGLLMSW
jgi:hypothetical protein